MKGIRLKDHDGIFLVDKAVLVDDTLIISDVHIGFEEALNRNGFLVPRTLFQQMMEDIEKLLSEISPRRIIVNGDFKHEFGRVSRQEWKDSFRFTEVLAKNSTELVFIKGNHDKILEPLAEKYSIRITDHILLDGIYITHGDSMPEDDDFKSASTVIIGHEHPCVTIRDDHKFEKFKAFLVGKYKDKHLIVTPSFNPVEGSDVMKEKLLSPFLKSNEKLMDFSVYVSAGDVFNFGRLGNLPRK